MKLKQNGLVKEWVKFSKADEQASVKASKYKRWSAARREKHRERLWGHVKHTGEGQVQVQAGTGQVGTTDWGSAEQVGVAKESGEEQLRSGKEWETPEGGVESDGKGQGKRQGPKWRAEDSTATETIFRSLSRKR